MEGHTEKDLSIEANNDTSSLKSDVREGEETISSSKTTNTPDNIYNRDGIISTKDSIVDKTLGETNDKMEIEEVNQQVRGKKGGAVVESVISEEKLLLVDTVENVVSDVLTGLIETIINEDTSKAQDSLKKETEICNNEKTKLNKLLAESVADNMAPEETMSNEGEDGNHVVDKLKKDASEIDTEPGTNDILLQDSCQIGRAEAVQHENYSEDDDSVGAFTLLGKRIGKKKKKKRKSKQSKRASLHIYEINKKDPLPSYTTKEESTVEVVTDHTNSIAESDCVDDTVGEEEDPLLFYSSAHEEQDPDYIEFHSSRLKRRLEAEMTMLQEEKNEDMQKIQAYVDAKGEERNASLQSEINRIRVSMIAKQTRQRTQLTEKHKKQIEADQNKIKDGERWLIEKQKQEMQARSEQHKGHQWSEIAFQLTERHKFQLKQFEEKKIEMSKRSAQEVNAQNQILEAHHRKRQIEGEKYIEDRVNETRRQQENLKARLLRLHRERFEQRQKEITLSCNVKTLAEGPVRQLNKDKTTKHTPHDAVVRQKKRKAVMNNKSIQLAVEIHNEGIIVISRSNQDECDEKSQGNESGPSSVFIPWGSKSKSFLYSLIVGEIPCGFIEELGEAGRGLLTGGLVKCVITDTRVSEDTAAHERADAFEQVVQAESSTNVDDIERRYKNTCAHMSSLKSECSSLMEKEEQLVLDHKMAALELDRSVAIMNKFKAQAQNFFNQDGTPNPRVNPDSQHKLISAMHRYKENHERATNKEATLRQPLELLAKKKAELQQAEQDVKSLGIALRRRRQSFTARRTDEEHSLATNIDRLNEALNSVAEKRRAQVIKNKGNSRSDKTFHQKMLRRRITTLLRPNVQTLVNDVKQQVSKNPRHRRKDCFDIVYDNDESISPDLRAEQLLYLAIHPQSDEVPLPQAPNENIPNERWCEPGWKLMLDADSDNNNSSNSILPIGIEGKLAQDNLSSCCSSRHAASLINRRHLRMLSECPFSFVSQASAPAESAPMMGLKEDKMVDDPMSATDEEMRLGYSFVVRHPTNFVADGVMKEGKKKRRSSKKMDTDQKDKPAAKKRIKEASPPAQLSNNNNVVPTNQQQIITDPQQADQYRLMMQMRLQAHAMLQQQQIMQGLPPSQIQQMQGMSLPPHLNQMISQQMQQGNHSSSGLPSPLQGGGSRQSSMTGSVNGGLSLSSRQNSIGMNPQLGPASNQHLPLPLPPPPPPPKK